MLYIRVLNLILSDLGCQGGYKGQFENLKVRPTHFLEWLEGQGGKVGDKDRTWKLLTFGCINILIVSSKQIHTECCVDKNENLY